MAVTNERSDQLKLYDQRERIPPGQANGRSRNAAFTHTQAANGDANSTVELCTLPPGDMFVVDFSLDIPSLGAARTVNVGWRAYTDPDGTQVAENLSGFLSGIDASSNIKTVIPYCRRLRAGTPVTVVLQVAGGQLDAAKTINGAVDYSED